MDSGDLGNVTVGPTEYTGQVTWSPALAIIMAIIACVGTAGNLLIIGSVCVERRLRVRGNAFIVNLAVADLIVTAYIMPIGIATSQYHLKPFSDELCDFNAFLFITTCGVSTQSLMLIAFERYIHVCKLSYYGKIFRPKLVALYLVLAWIYTMIWAAQGWTGWSYYIYGHDYYLCLFYGPASMSYSICLSLFGVILPIVVLTFCYVNIFRTVKNSKLALENHGTNTPSFEMKMRKKQLREHQFIFMLFIIVSVFCVCWAPGACVMALSGVLGPDGLPILAYTITIWIAICNSAMNSAIYGIMNNNFRRGYAHIVSRIFCCCCRQQGAHCSSSCDAKSAKSAARNDDTYKSYLSSGKATDTATELSTLPMSQGGFSKHSRSDVFSDRSDKRSKTTSKDTRIKKENSLKRPDVTKPSNNSDPVNDKRKTSKTKSTPVEKKYKNEPEIRNDDNKTKDANNNYQKVSKISESIHTDAQSGTKRSSNRKPSSEQQNKPTKSTRSKSSSNVKANWKTDDKVHRSHSPNKPPKNSKDGPPTKPKPGKTSEAPQSKDNPESSNVKGNWDKSGHSRSRQRSRSNHTKDRSKPENKASKQKRSKSSSSVKASYEAKDKQSSEGHRSHSSEGHKAHSSNVHKARSRSHSKHRCQHKNHSSKTCSHHARSHSKSSERTIDSNGAKPSTRDAQVEAKPNSNIVTLTLTANV